MNTIDTKTNVPNDDQGNTPTNRPTLEVGLSAANAARVRMIATRGNREPLQEWTDDNSSFRNRHHIVIQVGDTLMRYSGFKDTYFEPMY